MNDAQRRLVVGVPLFGTEENYPTFEERLVATIKELDRRAKIGERWRQLAVDLTRCPHGRVQGDHCFGCRGPAPDASHRHVGNSLYGKPVHIPTREAMHDPEAWYDHDR